MKELLLFKDRGYLGGSGFVFDFEIIVVGGRMNWLVREKFFRIVMFVEFLRRVL